MRGVPSTKRFRRAPSRKMPRPSTSDVRRETARPRMTGIDAFRACSSTLAAPLRRSPDRSATKLATMSFWKSVLRTTVCAGIELQHLRLLVSQTGRHQQTNSAAASRCRPRVADGTRRGSLRQVEGKRPRHFIVGGRCHFVLRLDDFGLLVTPAVKRMRASEPPDSPALRSRATAARSTAHRDTPSDVCLDRAAVCRLGLALANRLRCCRTSGRSLVARAHPPTWHECVWRCWDSEPIVPISPAAVPSDASPSR